MQKSKPDQALGSKQVFLLLFARELIKNSEEGLLQLKRVLEKEMEKSLSSAVELKIPENKPKQINAGEDRFPLIKSILSQAPRISLDGELSALKPVHIEPARREVSNGYGAGTFPVLRIPEPKLPPEFQHLRPIPTTREIELNKLNSLINDPAVKKIECDGPGKPVVVSGSMGRKPTEIVLSSDEIEEVVERFSKAAKIPVDVGVFRVVVGNLIFSAIISDIVPHRFVITKISSQIQMSFKPVPKQVPYPIKMSYSNYINPVNIPN